MEFEITYEIQRKDYARANADVVHHSRNSRLGMWVLFFSAWILLLLPWYYKQSDPNWKYPMIVVPLAAYLFYVSALWGYPYLNGLRQYDKHLSGRKYTARFSPEEVRVSGEYVTWIHQWPSFRFIYEAKSQFLFYDGITMYIFSKRYFSPDQEQMLRTLVINRAEKGRWALAHAK